LTGWPQAEAAYGPWPIVPAIFHALVLDEVNLVVESAMSLPLSKGSKGATQAEVVLQPQLKSCLVNLPSSLVSVLVNANTVATFCRTNKKPD
jgi:hypothetical protein